MWYRCGNSIQVSFVSKEYLDCFKLLCYFTISKSAHYWDVHAPSVTQNFSREKLSFQRNNPRSLSMNWTFAINGFNSHEESCFFFLPYYTEKKKHKPVKATWSRYQQTDIHMFNSLGSQDTSEKCSVSKMDTCYVSVSILTTLLHYPAPIKTFKSNEHWEKF